MTSLLLTLALAFGVHQHRWSIYDVIQTEYTDVNILRCRCGLYDYDGWKNHVVMDAGSYGTIVATFRYRIFPSIECEMGNIRVYDHHLNAWEIQRVTRP